MKFPRKTETVIHQMSRKLKDSFRDTRKTIYPLVRWTRTGQVNFVSMFSCLSGRVSLSPFVPIVYLRTPGRPRTGK